MKDPDMTQGLRYCWLIALLIPLVVGRAETVYQNDFTTVPLGEEPADFLVLDGAFTVVKDGTNRVLELPGAPLDNFGALFGPSIRGGSQIQVSVFSRSKGRLAPAFGVGVNGLGGFRALVSGNKRTLEILRGDELLASVRFRWNGDVWVHLLLQAAPQSDGKWRVRAKVWEGDADPQERWLVVLEDQDAPPRGKASIWGHPFSGQPIRYDHLKVDLLTP